MGHPFWALFRHTIGLRLASGVLGPFPRPWSSILIYLDFSKYYKFYNLVHRWHLNICVENACISRTKPKVKSVSSAHINKVASEVFTGIQWQEVSTQYARSTCTFPMFCPHKERAIYKTQMTFGW